MPVSFEVTESGTELADGRKSAEHEPSEVLIVVQVMLFRKARKACKGWRALEDRLTEAIAGLSWVRTRCGARKKEAFTNRLKQLRKLSTNRFKAFHAAVELAVKSGYVTRSGSMTRSNEN